MDIWQKMYDAAKQVQNARTVSPFVEAGGVAAAVLARSGNIYVGVCIDTCSSLGMCAERSAIANMLTNGEHEIEKVLAIMPDGRVGSPCGACRELMMQLDKNSGDIEILTDFDSRRTVKLSELAPDWWGMERFVEEIEDTRSNEDAFAPSEIDRTKPEMRSHTGEAVTLDEIRKRENAWKVALPTAYVSFLLEENGGEPMNRHFGCGDDICVIERYLSIIPDTSCSDVGMYDIDVVLTQVDERIVCDGEKLGYDIIPIAALYGGDLLCLDYRENAARPEICVWDHEDSNEFDPLTYYVCESWQELLAMVK